MVTIVGLLDLNFRVFRDRWHQGILSLWTSPGHNNDCDYFQKSRSNAVFWMFPAELSALWSVCMVFNSSFSLGYLTFNSNLSGTCPSYKFTSFSCLGNSRCIPLVLEVTWIIASLIGNEFVASECCCVL